MHHRYNVILFAILIPAIMFGQDGKVRGKITDKDSGDPLVGVTVLLDGTTLGASTDINGEYTVLAVPAGAYTVKVNYIGYAPYSLSNVRVSAGQTNTLDFKLASAAVQVGEIQVVAERPLIQRNTTNTVRTTTQEDLQNLPVRGVAAIVGLQPGVVTQAGRFYVRGGRAGETAYYIDGAPVTNPFTNTAYVSVVSEAVEEIQVQAGGFTAEFGGANSGIVSTNMRSGGSDYHGSLNFETDDFAKPGKEFLGTSGQGYRNIVATLSGPIPSIDELRFFVLYQNNYLRDRSYGWLTPFDFNLVGDSHDPNPGQSLPGPFAMKQNYVPSNWFTSSTGQGNFVYDAKSFKVRFTGSYEQQKLPSDQQLVSPSFGGGVGSSGRPFSNALYNYYRAGRYLETTNKLSLYSMKFTHVLDASTYYEISGAYQSRDSKRTDPDFGADWRSFADSSANAALGFTGFASRWTGPADYSVIDGFKIANANTPNNSFNKQKQVSVGGAADVVRQISQKWELKAGARYDRWTMRNFTVGTITGLMNFLYGNHGEKVTTFTDEDQRRALSARAGAINNFGYDVDGNEVSSGFDAPFHPTFASAYVQNKFEFDDLVFNAGLRFEYFKPGNKTFADPSDPQASFNTNLDVIDQSKLIDAPTYKYVLPRFSFSFPVTVATVFYAQYGKYVQMPALNQLFVGNTTLSRTVSNSTRGNAYLTPVGYLMTPERSTQYEMGIRQMLSDNFAFTLTGFYKDYRDQAQVRNYVSTQGVALYRSYLNGDFGTVKGVEMTFELRRVNRFAARVNYTMSDAQGTGSNPNASFGIIEQGIGRQINFINPLGYNERHKGTAMVDYRWGENDGGPVLSRLGLNMLFTFNSGHAYTKIKPLSSLGQSDPWNIGTYAQADPRNSFPAEPINSSTTPFFLNIDLGISKVFEIGPLKTEIYVNVTNLLNTKQVLNVYPSTGLAEDDGWLNNPLAADKIKIPQYAQFYRAINLDNRWSWIGLPERGQVLGAAENSTNDIYGIPRQIRVGARIEI